MPFPGAVVVTGGTTVVDEDEVVVDEDEVVVELVAAWVEEVPGAGSLGASTQYDLPTSTEQEVAEREGF